MNDSLLMNRLDYKFASSKPKPITEEERLFFIELERLISERNFDISLFLAGRKGNGGIRIFFQDCQIGDISFFPNYYSVHYLIDLFHSKKEILPTLDAAIAFIPKMLDYVSFLIERRKNL